MLVFFGYRGATRVQALMPMVSIIARPLGIVFVSRGICGNNVILDFAARGAGAMARSHFHASGNFIRNPAVKRVPRFRYFFGFFFSARTSLEL
jgi:hypothetical protein